MHAEALMELKLRNNHCERAEGDAWQHREAIKQKGLGPRDKYIDEHDLFKSYVINHDPSPRGTIMFGTQVQRGCGCVCVQW